MGQSRFAWISQLASKVALPDHFPVHAWSDYVGLNFSWWLRFSAHLQLALLFAALSSNSVPYASLIGSVSSLSSQTTTQSIYDNNSLPRFARKGLNIFVSVIFSVKAV